MLLAVNNAFSGINFAMMLSGTEQDTGAEALYPESERQRVQGLGHCQRKEAPKSH